MPESASPTEMCSNENYLDEFQDNDFKSIIINFKELKEKHKQLKDLEENKCVSNAQEHTNIRLMEMMKKVQNLKTKFNKETELLRRTQAELKMKLKIK